MGVIPEQAVIQPFQTLLDPGACPGGQSHSRPSRPLTATTAALWPARANRLAAGILLEGTKLRRGSLPHLEVGMALVVVLQGLLDPIGVVNLCIQPIVLRFAQGRDDEVFGSALTGFD
jgi:hypothetical protein